MTWVLYVGVRESARANALMVGVKVTVIAIVVVAGLSYIDTSNWTPYVPANTGTFGHFGWSGVMKGAAIMFFAYVGFDTASTTALETRNPQRDRPIGILGTLIIATLLYVAMAAVLTGMLPLSKLDTAAPVAVALDAHPQLSWLSWIVKVVIASMTSVILASSSAAAYPLSMADDGLLPT
jgi:APA family basic amino acid/polyamine antiporter